MGFSLLLAPSQLEVFYKKIGLGLSYLILRAACCSATLCLIRAGFSKSAVVGSLDKGYMSLGVYCGLSFFRNAPMQCSQMSLTGGQQLAEFRGFGWVKMSVLSVMNTVRSASSAGACTIYTVLPPENGPWCSIHGCLCIAGP